MHLAVDFANLDPDHITAISSRQVAYLPAKLQCDLSVADESEPLSPINRRWNEYLLTYSWPIALEQLSRAIYTAVVLLMEHNEPRMIAVPIDVCKNHRRKYNFCKNRLFIPEVHSLRHKLTRK